MGISYKKTKLKINVNPLSNAPTSFVFGYEGTCSVTGNVGYVDAVWPVTSEDSVKNTDVWSKEAVDLEWEKCIVSNDMQHAISKKLANKADVAVEVSDFDYSTLT